MPIRFSCPSCGAVLQAESAQTGQTFPCPRCDRPIQVPSNPPSRLPVARAIPPQPAASHLAQVAGSQPTPVAAATPNTPPPRWLRFVTAGVVVFAACFAFAVLTSILVTSLRKPTHETNEFQASDLFANVSPAVVLVEVRDEIGNPIGRGSGFVLTASGLLVTNAHVVTINRAASVAVTLSDDRTFLTDEVESIDVATDLAILRIKAEGLPCLELEDKAPTTGERVFAVGNPLGLAALRNTLSEGLVSGVRTDGDRTIIQTTASISQGSSGGPLLNKGGKVIGVTSALIAEGQNLNFAVAAADVQRLVSRSPVPQKICDIGDGGTEGDDLALK